MKKLLALILAMIMVFSLCACDRKRSRDKDDETESVETTAAKVNNESNSTEGTDTAIPVKNLTADMVITADGQQVPCIAKCDFEAQEMVLSMDMDETTGIIAIDDEEVYIVTEENGEVVNGRIQKLEDFYSEALSRAGITALSQAQAEDIMNTLQGALSALESGKGLDTAAITDILNELGLDLKLDDLCAQLGITEEQAQNALNAITNLLNDEQWLMENFAISNNVNGGTGSFSFESDLSKVVYDVMAAVSEEMGQEPPAYEESGIPSMPLTFSGQLKDYVLTVLNASFEYLGQKTELAITNDITENSIDFDATLSAAGSSFTLSIDGKADNGAVSLKVDLTARGQTVTLFDLSGNVSDSKLVMNITAGVPDDQIIVALESEIADGKPATIKLDMDIDGEKVSIDADISGYDSTDVDVAAIKSKAEAAMAA